MKSVRYRFKVLDFFLCIGVLLGCAFPSYGQAPGRTKLKNVLVLNKSQYGLNGHRESRADFMKALAGLAFEKEFTVTTIEQNTPQSSYAAEFSTAGLANYQAVIFCYNDGVHAQLDSTQKKNFEAYVKNGGGYIPIHSASDFIEGWPWMTSVLVESFYGAHGSNMPTANLHHDFEGTSVGAETQGIFRGLKAPLGFLDEFYSFRASPRGRPGVTILLTVDERTFSKSVNGPMGEDHPVAWAKSEGLGRVAHISLGHSWSTNNVYEANGGYLKYFLYGALRYVAGDFIGCTDSRYAEYHWEYTKSDSTACITHLAASISHPDGKSAQAIVFRNSGKNLVHVDLRGVGAHSVAVLDITGKVVFSKSGLGAAHYSLPVPLTSGRYTVVAKSGREVVFHRVTVL